MLGLVVKNKRESDVAQRFFSFIVIRFVFKQYILIEASPPFSPPHFSPSLPSSSTFFLSLV